MSKSLRGAVVGVLAAVACLLGALGMAIPAHAAEACRLTPESLTASNLQHDGGKDWIWLRVDDEWWPGYWDSATFSAGQTHTITGFSVPFTGTIETEVVLDGALNRSIEIETVSGGNCATEEVPVRVVYSNGDATYVMNGVAEPNS